MAEKKKMSPKDKKLAALTHPKGKITRGDVIKGAQMKKGNVKKGNSRGR